MSQEPLNSNNSLENEELTEEDLDAIAGGQALPILSNNLLPLSEDQMVKPSDNMFQRSVDQDADFKRVLNGPMNMSLSFP